MASNPNSNNVSNNKQNEVISFSYEKNKEEPLLIVYLDQSNNQGREPIKINLKEGKMKDFERINTYILKKISVNTEIVFLVNDNTNHPAEELKEVTKNIKMAYECTYKKIMEELGSSDDINI